METTQKKKNSLWKIIRNIAIGFVLTVAVLMTGIFAFHRISLNNEASKIVDYGTRVPVYDGEINVRIEGTGSETLVLLTGYGTASPGLDFTPLINELKNDYRIVVIEPFGYGLSSQTKRERTLDNMSDEIHEVVTALGIDSYVLGGHSIAGIYGLNYVNKYPEGIKGFVGIDTSNPIQPWPGVDDSFLAFVSRSGLLRVITSLSPTQYVGFDDDTIKQLNMITHRNASNPTVHTELKELGNSFESSKHLSFPTDLPVIFFVADASLTNIPNWYELHYSQIEGLTKGKVVEMHGGHYLHHTQSPEIARQLVDFFK